KCYFYGDTFLHEDELAWAAAALFAATGASTYDQQLRTWLTDPSVNGPEDSEPCAAQSPDDGTGAPCRTWQWGWWQMYMGYGCAARDYAFAARSQRQPGAFDPIMFPDRVEYLKKCHAAITNWGDLVRLWSTNNAYRTSLTTSGLG